MVKMAKHPDYIEREVVPGGGVYCFFVFDELDKKSKGVFKIGMAINFQKRIAGYHTYLPGGLYYKCLLEDPSLKRSGRSHKVFYTSIEREIFSDIKAHGGKVIEMKIRKRDYGETEWIYATESSINDAFDRAYKKYGVKNTHVHIIDDLDKELKPLAKQLKKNPLFEGRIYL